MRRIRCIALLVMSVVGQMGFWMIVGIILSMGGPAAFLHPGGLLLLVIALGISFFFLAWAWRQCGGD